MYRIANPLDYYRAWNDMLSSTETILQVISLEEPYDPHCYWHNSPSDVVWNRSAVRRGKRRRVWWRRCGWGGHECARLHSTVTDPSHRPAIPTIFGKDAVYPDNFRSYRSCFVFTTHFFSIQCCCTAQWCDRHSRWHSTKSKCWLWPFQPCHPGRTTLVFIQGAIEEGRLGTFGLRVFD